MFDKKGSCYGYMTLKALLGMCCK